MKSMLRGVGLRPTLQRLALGWILFGKGHRHLTAEMLYEEASRARVPVSLATVYNTLHQFTEVGLLRQVAVDGSKTYFDTNVSEHHHFFLEDKNALVDIPPVETAIGALPALPEGYEVERVDVVVRLKTKGK
nr:Fur family transcriptional regulator [Rhodoplanes serenus]